MNQIAEKLARKTYFALLHLMHKFYLEHSFKNFANARALKTEAIEMFNNEPQEVKDILKNIYDIDIQWFENDPITFY